MLPDFPILKRQLIERIHNDFSNIVQQDSLLSAIPTSYVYEGSKLRSTDMSGYEEAKDFHRTGGEMEFDYSEIEERGFHVYCEKLNEIQEQIQREIANHFLETSKKVSERCGNAIDAKGEAMTEKHVLNMLAQVELPFRENGEPDFSQGSFVLHPSMEQTLRKCLQNIQENPEHRATLEKIIEQQRRDWRARKDHRKLVD